MLLAGYKHSSYNHLLALPRLARNLRQAFLEAFVLRSSLLASYRVPSLLSEITGADLKKSGLLRSILCSATQNLAYLPCRIGSDGSTILFFSGGGIAKKTHSPLHHQGPIFLRLYGRVCPHPQSSFQGALRCDLRTIRMLQSRFPSPRTYFARRHLHGLRPRCIAGRREPGRSSSLAPLCEHGPECWARNASSPVAARRRASSQHSRVAAASARITAASLSSPVFSSQCNPRPYF